jgi:hypothetical protein
MDDIILYLGWHACSLLTHIGAYQLANDVCTTPYAPAALRALQNHKDMTLDAVIELSQARSSYVLGWMVLIAPFAILSGLFANSKRA